MSKNNLSDDQIDQLYWEIRNGDYRFWSDIADVFRQNALPAPVARKWIKDKVINVRAAAVTSCGYCDDLLLDVIEYGLLDSETFVNKAAYRACMRRCDIPYETIKKWAIDANINVRTGAMWYCYPYNVEALIKKGVLWDIIDRGLNDKKSVKTRALNARLKILELLNSSRAKNVHLNLSYIEKWSADRDAKIRQATLELCQCRSDVPWDIIERGLLDPRKEVRETAKAVCMG